MLKSQQDGVSGIYGQPALHPSSSGKSFDNESLSKNLNSGKLANLAGQKSSDIFENQCDEAVSGISAIKSEKIGVNIVEPKAAKQEPKENKQEDFGNFLDSLREQIEKEEGTSSAFMPFDRVFNSPDMAQDSTKPSEVVPTSMGGITALGAGN